MEEKKSSPIHGESNVIPFTREKRSHSEEKNIIVESYEVDVLVCSLCGDNSFFLLNEKNKTDRLLIVWIFDRNLLDREER